MTGILSGKVALVTGGASGIGRATALAMAREGARLAVADRTDASASATVELINAAGGQAIAFGGDVTRENDVADMVALRGLNQRSSHEHHRRRRFAALQHGRLLAGHRVHRGRIPSPEERLHSNDGPRICPF
jgi:hypothetical protein